jgi:hypothetical protein
VIVIKWRDTAWKEVLCDGAESAIEYFMPDLAADMDPTREIDGIPGRELFSEASDSDKHMLEPDVFFNIPMLNGENGNIALFAEQQHEPNENLPRRVFETYIRLREKLRLRTTCIVVYTGSSPNVDTYAESCYGCEVSMKYRTYYLPEKSADELRADNHPFARVMLAGRLSLDAGDNIGLREKYAMEILNATTEQNYDDDKKFFILDFAERIFRLRDPRVSESVKGAYKMQTVPLEEYRKQIKLQNARLEGMEECMEKGMEKGIEKGIEKGREELIRSMLADGLPLQQVAKISGWPVDKVQKLKPH